MQNHIHETKKQFALSRSREIIPLTNIMETEERSPSRLGEGSIGLDASPVSSIISDLHKSSLGPRDAKKRYFQRSGGIFGASHLRMNDRKNEGIAKCASHNKGLSEVALKTKFHRFCSKLLNSPPRNNSMLETYDKENDSDFCNWKKSSPQKILKTRWPLDDYDPNSQDSGYGASVNDKDDKRHDGFQFAEPSGLAPRRLSVDSRSPLQSPMRSSPMRSSPMRSSPMRSSPVRSSPMRPLQQSKTSRSSLMRLSSGYESMDDGFTELIDMETLDDTTHLPSSISTLLSGDLVTPGTSSVECDVSTTPEFSQTSSERLRRSLSLCEQISLSKVRTCLFHSPDATSSTVILNDYETDSEKSLYSETQSQSVKSYKRPSEDSDESSKLVNVKKLRMSKSFCLDEPQMMIPNPKISILQRSLSETEASIKSAIHRSVTDSDLTGDFSKPCILPLATGDHEDLKSITSDTLAALIRGEFSDRINSYRIVDCRYPYEYDGGHIEGALNLYTKDLIEKTLLDPLTMTPSILPDTNKRDILVFHCEFSWERGPNLSRFLRKLDRQRNKEHYPALHYPEIYLLHGGYKYFYREQKEFCSPQGYRPMRHPDHEEDLRQFRSKSKSWQGDKPRIANQTMRTNLKRLGF